MTDVTERRKSFCNSPMTGVTQGETHQLRGTPARAHTRASAVTEREWQAQLIAMLRLHGWNPIYHTWRSDHSPAGFPDLIAVRDGRLLAIECKVGKRKVTEQQLAWLQALEGVKVVDAFVSRPADDLSALEELVA